MTRSALDGLVVVDLSRVLAGPYATMLLGDLGAEVIKIERPGIGDETREWAPPVDAAGTSTYFGSVNRNKDARSIDLGTPAGVEEVRELIRGADVLVENFRAGYLDGIGLGYETVRELNPRLVYCSITGFGAGAGAHLPGFDLLIQAVGGLMSVTGPSPEQPTKTGVALVDVITGLHALTGILAAVIARGESGEGQHVEVNLLSSLLSGLVNQAGAYLGAGVVPRAMGNAHPSIAPYEVLPTADRPLALAVGTDAQFRELAAELGVPELGADERFATNHARVANRPALTEILTARLATASADEWVERLGARRVPVGPINSLDGAFALAERLGLAPVVDIDGHRSVSNPISLSATPAVYRSAPPPLAEPRG